MYIRPTFLPHYSIIPLCEIHQQISSTSDLLMPAYFWRQRVSGAGGFLVAAHFW